MTETDKKMFEYVGSGKYHIGLPKRDLYASDMARCERQGWPKERIEALGLYALVEADEPEEIVEEEGNGDTVL